jgi:hypothetical protein
MTSLTHSRTFRRLWYKEGRDRWSGESPVLAQRAPVGTRGVSAPRGRAGENWPASLDARNRGLIPTIY